MLLAVAAPFYAQENEAEKLIRLMEKEIAHAKGLKVSAETTYYLGGEVVKNKGAVQFGTQNKARLVFEGPDLVGRPSHLLIVSDGKQMHIQSRPEEKPTLEPTPKNLSKCLGEVLVRGGLAMASNIVENQMLETFDLDKELAMSGFKMGAKEKIGNVEAQIIEYKMKFRSGPADFTLWIDPKTHLPLKRQLLNDKGFKMIETYSEFVITPNLDPSIFELPKASEKKKPKKGD